MVLTCHCPFAQTPGLNVITEYIIGYLYPGYPVANMCFKVYGYISMKQGLTFLQDLKLGHYMKIPPRAMFMAQVGFSFPPPSINPYMLARETISGAWLNE